MSELGLKPVGTIAAGKSLQVSIKGANVTIRHEQRDDVAVLANRPDHWSLTAFGELVQTKVQPAANSIHISGNCINIAGSVIGTVIGVRQVVTGIRGAGCVSINGNQVIMQDEAGNPVVIETNGGSVSVTDNEVWVDGVKVYPKSEVPAGGAVPAAASAEPKEPEVKGPDILEVLVPLEFSGALMVVIDDGSATVDRWKGNNAWLHSTGDGTVNCGEIDVSDYCILMSDGDGDIAVGDILATRVSIAFTDDGKLSGSNVSAREFVATAIGDGGITFSGCINAEQSVNCLAKDDGPFKAAKVQTRSFSASLMGDASVTIAEVEATNSVNLRLEDDGDFHATSVKTVDFTGAQTADGNVRIKTLEAAGVVTWNITDDGGFKATDVAAASFSVKSNGDGEVEITGSLHVSGNVQLESKEDGAIELGRVKCAAFSSSHTGDGGLEAAEVVCETISLTNRSDANITISAGSAKSGSVSNSGDGSVRLTSGFATLKQSNTGDGRIRIK